MIQPFVVNDLSDPTGSNAIVAAVDWLQGGVLGTIATTVAIIAVASVGYGMLTGRTNWRRGASVIVGCFIVFGVSSIVAGIRSTTEPAALYAPLQTAQTSTSIVIPRLPPQPPSLDSDPYSGATVPTR